MKILLAAITLGALLCGCAGPGPEIYAGQKPALDLRAYFAGTVDAWGMFQGRDGEVAKRFSVRINCAWEGDSGTLDESFLYADGTRSRRVWHLTRVDEHHWLGRADDVVGEAKGVVYGNALHWRYVLDLPVGTSRYNVDFDDWMYLVDEHVMLNRSVMSKFGVRLGEVLLSFRRPGAP